ncbi:cytochrome P450 2A13-like [Alligator mississippiensis]|uniref:cytochrome P450 2A13-like n=1 Tax=Alligator mississippiensis TaxID=8496 RepID=UPI0028777747|nr:cytochrome P450 2A13-like [Alligator mississippiensis]
MELLDAVTLFLALCLSCLMLLSMWWQMQGRSKMPPGPMPLPLVGNLLHVGTKNVFKALMKLSKKYGPIYTIQLGTRRVVVLCGYRAVKEALLDQGEEFGGRGKQATFDFLFKGYGVAFSNGERARQLRRFSITTLRNFGVGKRSIEERILDEAQYLLGALHDTKGLPFDPTYILSRSVSNVISSVLFGDRFDYEDKEFLSLLYMVLETFRFTSTSWGQLYDMFPGIMNYLPGPQHKSFKLLAGLEKYMEKKVKANEETLDPNSPRDFIDCFLIKMHQEKQSPSSEFFLENIVMTALSVFFGGTETVSTTLRYSFLILLKYPEIEEKIHQEIDQVIGRNRSPSIEDRSCMPYTDAVIHECQRFCNILPLGLSRQTTKDTQFCGYNIPQGTEVFALLGSVLKDPEHFERPEAFDPGHFLDDKGQFKKNEAFMPFSIGKRFCFGEMLARMELFLFVTSILQHFRFESPIDRQDLDISPKLVGFANLPRDYKICLIPR